MKKMLFVAQLLVAVCGIRAMSSEDDRAMTAVISNGVSPNFLRQIEEVNPGKSNFEVYQQALMDINAWVANGKKIGAEAARAALARPFIDQLTPALKKAWRG